VTTNLPRLAATISAGSAGPVANVTLPQFNDLYGQILKHVPADRADIVVALVNGRALVGFPRLSRQVLHVVAVRGRLRRADFEFPSAANIRVVGTEATSSLEMLRHDIRQCWWLPALLVVALVAIYALGAVDAVVAPVATALTVSSGLFFTVFVLFGVGEVIRKETSQALFEAGFLQQSLDADRYLVRLAVAGFLTAILASGTMAIAPGITAAFPQVAASPIRVMDATGLTLMLISATAVGLSLWATVTYLVDRASETALQTAARDVLDTARADHAERPAAGLDAQPTEAVPGRHDAG
jgi:hypothetical protein